MPVKRRRRRRSMADHREQVYFLRYGFSFGREPFDYDGAKVKVIQFAQACVKDKSTEGETPARVAEAKKFLAQVESESPDLIRQTRRVVPLPK